MLCVYITNKEELLAFFKMKEFPHGDENQKRLSKKQNITRIFVSYYSAS